MLYFSRIMIYVYAIQHYRSKRPLNVINSCTVRKIYALKDEEKLEFPSKSVSQFCARGGKTPIVVFLMFSYRGQFSK